MAGGKQESDEILVNRVLIKLAVAILRHFLSFCFILLRQCFIIFIVVDSRWLFLVKFIAKLLIKCRILKMCTISDRFLLFNYCRG